MHFDEKCTPFTNNTQNIGALIFVGKTPVGLTQVGPISFGMINTSWASNKCDISLTIFDNRELTQTTYENIARLT